jgi:hypothetical protein
MRLLCCHEENYHIRLSDFGIPRSLPLFFAANAQQKTVKTVRPAPTASLDGKTLSRVLRRLSRQRWKGDGPAVDALKQRPSDLTQINRNNNGKFPTSGFSPFSKANGR